MSGLTTTDPAQLMRIRAEEVLDRGGAARQVGELAGQFAMMLEQLNGVGTETPPSAVQPVAGLDGGLAQIEGQGLQRLGVGAVSLFAQELAGQTDQGSTGSDNGFGADMEGFPSLDQRFDPAPAFADRFGNGDASEDAARHIIQDLLTSDKAQNTDFRWLATLFSSVDNGESNAG